MTTKLPLLARLLLCLIVSCAAAGTAFAQDGADRPIQRADLLIIDVFNEKTLSVECRVQASGTIRYPLLGDIEVAGKTTPEVASLLKEKLGEDYLVNPEVSVTVKQYRLRTVTVIGKVNKPGPVILPEEERMDIVQAIGAAGGFAATANQNRIHFSRAGKTTTLSFRELKKITEDDKRMWLEPNDVIEVKETIF